MTRFVNEATVFGNVNSSQLQSNVGSKDSELIDGFLSAVCAESQDGFATLDQVAELEEILSLHLTSEVIAGKPALLAPEDPVLVKERNTWRLFGRLFLDELRQKQQIQDEMDASSSNEAGIFNSEKEVVEHVFKTDMKIRRAQVVVDWLEQIAREVFETRGVDVSSASICGWENTLAALLGKINTKRPDMVTAMDPDAPLRQKKSLHDLDARDELEYSKFLFMCIRAGKNFKLQTKKSQVFKYFLWLGLLETAQEMSERTGSPWKAVTLDGWKLYHDPNLGRGQQYSEEILPVEGNQNRDLWKRMALKFTQDSRVPR